MTIWYKGSGIIDCDLRKIKVDLDDIGKHYLGIISLMPGLTNVELMDQGNDYVIIKTNEGLMKRTSITITFESGIIIVECDEEYKAGSKITTRSHFRNEFETSKSKVRHTLIISNVKATGLLGFFYRKFGGSNIGKSMMNSYKSYFENREKQDG